MNHSWILFRIALKVRALKETTTLKKRMMKITDYITYRYGSVHAFKLLKYFLEHKLARENKGFAVYEISFHIAPSEILTPYALIKIECIADDAEQKDAQAGLDLLMQKGILKNDAATDILELNVPLDSIANVYLRETENGFEIVKDRSLADVILLPTAATRVPKGKKDHGKQANVAGVPDILEKDKHGRYTIVEIKLGTPYK